jgi:hypothetical protein
MAVQWFSGGGNDNGRMNVFKTLPRLVAAAIFAATAATSVVVADATHAGTASAPASGVASTASGLSSVTTSAASPAAAAEIFVGLGTGPHRYWRYAWRGGAWVRIGYYNGWAPGYIPGGYYVGWAPPRYAYYHPYYGYRAWYVAHPWNPYHPYNPYYRHW